MRNTIARAFSVVASTLDIAFPPSSRLAVLPPLCTFLWCIAHALCDEQQKVWTVSALGLTALTEINRSSNRISTSTNIASFSSVINQTFASSTFHEAWVDF